MPADRVEKEKMIKAGTILQNRYLVKRQVGAGGMGTVYIATDQRFGSIVAVKETIFTDANLRKAFAREAQLLNSLRHPALPRVSDYFEEDSGMFLVMEYIEGDDLMEKLDTKKNGFAVAEVLRWADQLLDALDYLHTQQRPVVHRDIKPQNLKLTLRGDIVLLDFGLAKGTTNDGSSVSITKSVFGYSRNYAPLEQIQGTGTDTHSDLYSLGATLYHLSTGSPPLDALTRATTVINGSEDPVKLASETKPQIPVVIAEILNKAMSLNPAARFETAEEMRRALKTAGESAGIAFAENVSRAADVFNQKTEVVGAGIADKDVGAATAAVKSSASTNPGGGATSVDDAQPDKSGASGISLQIPVETAAAAATKRRRAFGRHDSFVESPRQPSTGRIFGIAAAVVILCGGVLAAWYATSGAMPSGNSIVSGANANQKPGFEDKSKSVTASTVTVNQAADSGNSGIAAPKDSTAAGGSGAKTTVTDAPANEGLDKVENKNPTQNPRQVPADIPLPEKEGAGTEDKPNVEEGESEDDSDIQIRDLRNAPPEEREKMRLQIKKQKADQLRRRIEDELRRKQQRREQNLPDEEPENRDNQNRR